MRLCKDNEPISGFVSSFYYPEHKLNMMALFFCLWSHPIWWLWSRIGVWTTCLFLLLFGYVLHFGISKLTLSTDILGLLSPFFILLLELAPINIVASNLSPQVWSILFSRNNYVSVSGTYQKLYWHWDVESYMSQQLLADRNGRKIRIITNLDFKLSFISHFDEEP